MAYTSPFYQFVIGGNIDAGASIDTWQIGLKVPVNAALNALSEFDGTTLLNDAKNDAVTWWTAIKGYYAPVTSLAFVKANLVGTDGKYLNQSKTFRADFTEIPGTAASNPLPSEVAFVVTLHTAAARGLAAKGRVYLPAPASGSALQQNGRVDNVGYGTAVRNATAQLVSNIGNKPGLDSIQYGDTSVMSEVREGATRRVTHCSTDDLWDTQRRRGSSYSGGRSTLTPIP